MAQMRVRHGDSFIMLINWDKAGKVWSQSIQPYGSATNRPDSPHYTDQMQLFFDRKFKPVHFEWADAVAARKTPLSALNAVCRKYRPISLCLASAALSTRANICFREL